MVFGCQVDRTLSELTNMWVVGGKGRGGVVIPRGGNYWDIFPLVVVILIDPSLTHIPQRKCHFTNQNNKGKIFPIKMFDEMFVDIDMIL